MLGAAQCSCHRRGFSAAAIEQARALAAEAGLEARFVGSDVYELPDQLNGTFDIVYTSRGVLGWLPDIEGWARVAARFGRPGGLYMTEIQPVAQVFDDDDGVTELRLRYPCFSHADSIVSETQGSYDDRNAMVAQGGRVRLLECCWRLILVVETSVMWPMSNLLAGPLAALSGGRPRTGCGLLLIAVAFAIAIFIAVTR